MLYVNYSSINWKKIQYEKEEKEKKRQIPGPLHRPTESEPLRLDLGMCIYSTFLETLKWANVGESMPYAVLPTPALDQGKGVGRPL